MRSILAAAALATALSACAPKPDLYASKLEDDPKFNSPECQEIRLKALDYDDKVGQRMAIGLASGLLLGPFGLPFAIAADTNQDEKRRAFSLEVHRRCSSLPAPPELLPKPKINPQDARSDNY